MVQLSFSTLNHSAMYPNAVELPDQLRAVADAGFTFVSPDPFSLRAWSASGASPGELVEMVNASGLICYEFPGVWISDDDDATQRNAEQMLQFATALGVEWVEVMVTVPVDDAVRERFRRVCEPFGRNDIGMAIEFSPYTPLDGISEATALARSAQSEAMTGILIDTWHFFKGKSEWSDLDALDLTDLAFIQMADGPADSSRREDARHLRTVPGEGELDLAAFAQRLRGKGWDGAVVLEVLSAAGRDLPVSEFARRCREGALPFWN